MSWMLGQWSRALSCAALLAGLFGLAGNAMAAPVSLSGIPVPISGNSERIVSLRHQDHMWEAADGSTYLIVNRGTVGGADALQVYSSPDHGLSWYAGPRLPGSDRFSTSDGYLANGILYVTYSTSAGTIVSTALKQVRVTAVGTWKVLGSETAFSSADTIAMNPAMAVDALGTAWLAFVGQDVATGNYAIKLLRNDSQGGGWIDTGLVFGDVDNASIERSARPVATATGMGMVYAVHEQIFWASRENGADPDAAWSSQVLFTSTSSDNDPYASHFSVVADPQGNIHMAISDGGRVGYFRFNATSRQWVSKWLSGDISAGYVQVAMAGTNVVVTSNNLSNVVVYKSTNSGATFTNPYSLVHPAPSGGISYPYPRIETAARTAGPMLLLQQYVDNNLQRLLLFSVPVP